jgi:FkbM family methyltransferase
MKRIIIIFKAINSIGLKSTVVLIFKNIFASGIYTIKIPNVNTRISIRKNTSDLYCFFDVFVYNQYDFKYTNLDVIIDAGSNAGYFAIKMKSLFPTSKIICIEPDKDNFKLLTENTKNYNDIILENAGLWNRDTNLKVYDKHNNGKWGMVVEEEPNGQIYGLTLNTILNKYNLNKIDLIKIDIETSEKIIFNNNYENWMILTNKIAIELHDDIDEGCSKTFFTALNKVYNKYSFEIHNKEIIIITNLNK